MKNKKNNIVQHIKKGNLGIFEALQKNKINMLIVLEDPATIDLLKVAALNPENSEQVSEFLNAALRTLRRMKTTIKEQKTTTKSKLKNMLEIENKLIDDAANILESAIQPDERLDIKEFQHKITKLSKSFKEIQKQLQNANL